MAEMKFTHRQGKDCGKIIFFAISTCIWCKKTKKLLDSHNIAYDYIDVDLAPREVRQQVKAEMKKWGDEVRYPFIIVNDERCIKGYKEEEIKELSDGE